MRWYADNGWTYPIFGPTASGVAAVQQLFEALGIVRAPTLALSDDAVDLRGAVGARIEYTLAVVTNENRAAIAFATSDQPWLVAGPTVFLGRVATIPLTVAQVPPQAGQTLHARLSVTANGQQRFQVPVRLAVVGAPAAADGGGRLAPQAAAPVVVVAEDGRTRFGAARRARCAGQARGRRSSRRAWFVFGALLCGLLGGIGLTLYLTGYFARPAQVSAPHLVLAFQDNPRDEVVGAETMTFGLTLRPENGDKAARPKRLTFDERGRTNNVCYRLDGKEFLLGSGEGRWETADAALPGQGRRSVWVHKAVPLTVVQQVEVLAAGAGQNETCLVHYTLKNQDAKAHCAGLRILLDTFIATHDGVPFAVPGLDTGCDTSCDLRKANVPDFVQAFEADDLRNSGVVARLTLRLGSKLEAPGRFTLGAWPARSSDEPRALDISTGWEVPLGSIKAAQDSAATIYWTEQELAPCAKRDLGFTYGLGEVTADSSGRLGLSIGGPLMAGTEFTAMAYVQSPAPNETLTLRVPPGLTLVSGTETLPVPETGHLGLVAWKLCAEPGAET